MLKKVQGDQTDIKLKWSHEHQALSVSICSNMEKYIQSKCIVNPDFSGLLTSMVTCPQTISNAGYWAALLKWCRVFESLDELKDRWKKAEEAPMDVDDEEEEEEGKKKPNKMLNRLSELKKSFNLYCHQMPVLGFNSSWFDLNLLKAQLNDKLNLDTDPHGHVIKKLNCYTCISTSQLKFLDIMNFLSPGYSYAKFLKAFGMEETKSYFPFEWFDDVAKLNFPELPPYETFLSSFKGKNMLEEGSHVLGQQRYVELKTIWDKDEMSALRDWLVYYNKLGVGPFITAVERMQRFYFDKGMDMFKVAVTAPGIARRWIRSITREEGATFALVDPQDNDLYYMLKGDLVGGLSVIYSRYHEVDKTFIGDNPMTPCRTIEGYDANALYLYCIRQEMPTGCYVRRHAPDFKPDGRTQHEVMPGTIEK